MLGKYVITDVPAPSNPSNLPKTANTSSPRNPPAPKGQRSGPQRRLGLRRLHFRDGIYFRGIRKNRHRLSGRPPRFHRGGRILSRSSQWHSPGDEINKPRHWVSTRLFSLSFSDCPSWISVSTWSCNFSKWFQKTGDRRARENWTRMHGLILRIAPMRSSLTTASQCRFLGMGEQRGRLPEVRMEQPVSVFLQGLPLPWCPHRGCRRKATPPLAPSSVL